MSFDTWHGKGSNIIATEPNFSIADQLYELEKLVFLFVLFRFLLISLPQQNRRQQADIRQ